MLENKNIGGNIDINLSERAVKTFCFHFSTFQGNQSLSLIGFSLSDHQEEDETTRRNTARDAWVHDHVILKASKIILFSVIVSTYGFIINFDIISCKFQKQKHSIITRKIYKGAVNLILFRHNPSKIFWKCTFWNVNIQYKNEWYTLQKLTKPVFAFRHYENLYSLLAIIPFQNINILKDSILKNLHVSETEKVYCSKWGYSFQCPCLHYPDWRTEVFGTI